MQCCSLCRCREVWLRNVLRVLFVGAVGSRIIQGLLCSEDGLLVLTGVPRCLIVCGSLFKFVVMRGGFQSPCLVLEPAHGGGNGSNVQGAPQRASRLKMRGVCLHAEPQILGAPGLGVVPNAVFCQPVPGKKFSSSASQASQGSNESASSILASLAIRPGMDLQSDRGTLIAHRWLSTIPPLYSAACPSTF